MVVGRTEGVVGHSPARREDDEIGYRCAGLVGRGREHREDRRILNAFFVESIDNKKKEQVEGPSFTPLIPGLIPPLTPLPVKKDNSHNDRS